MNYHCKVIVLVGIFALYGLTQVVDNFDFTTLDGTHYNLYNDLLNKKKPVLFHTMTSS